MRSKRLTVTYLAAAALATTVFIAFAQPPDRETGFGETGIGGRHPWHGRMKERLVEYLELDEQQRLQWESLEDSRNMFARDLFAQLRDLHDGIEGLLGSPSPDAAVIGELVIEAHRQRENMRTLHADFEERFEAILRSDQLERWEAFEALRPERARGPRFGRPFEHGDFGEER